MEAFKRVRPKINGIYQQFQREGKIKNPREDVLIFYHVSDGVIHFNSTRVVKLSPLDAFDLSETERRAREQVYELYHFMKDNIEGFENCTLLASAPQTGVRESRMVDGAYTLTCLLYTSSADCWKVMFFIVSTSFCSKTICLLWSEAGSRSPNKIGRAHV